MDTQKVATNYRLTKWAQIIQTRLSRGQSIKDFCESEGISRNTYFYWQRKLRETACTELSKQTSVAVNEIVPEGWTQLKAEKEEKKLIIEAGGCRISVTGETDPQLMVKVCRALKSL